MTERPIRRALISVSDKSGLIEFARGLKGHGVQLISTGGTAKVAARRRPRRDRRVRRHRLSGDHGRAGEDAPSENPRRPLGESRRAVPHRSDARARHRGDRPARRQSLSVRVHGRARRRFRDRGREHRHRRPGDDPRGGEEPRLGHGRRRSRGLSAAPFRDDGNAGQGARRDAPPARADRLRAHRRLRRQRVELARSAN